MGESLNVINEIEQIKVSDSFVCTPENCNQYLPVANNDILKVFHVNIRSIGCNFPHLLTMLHRLNTSLDVILLSECWLSKCPSVPTIPGYSPCLSTFTNQNDGVVAYVRETISFSYEIPDFKEANCILLKFSNKLAILSVYRSPSYRDTDSFVLSLDATLESLKGFSHVSVIGDININIISDNSNPNAEFYLNTLASHALLPAHIFPTRNSNCLDHVMLRTTNTAVTLVFDSFITDHAPILLCCNLKLQTSHVKRLCKHTDVAACTQELQITDFTPILACCDSELAASAFVRMIMDIVNRHTCLKYIPSRKRIIKPWITPGLLRCLRNRDKLYRDTKKDPKNHTKYLIYNRYKNFINNLIKKVKREYECNEFRKIKNSPKDTWKLIKNIGNINKITNPAKELISCAEPTLVVNKINNVFANVGKELALKITNGNRSAVLHSPQQTRNDTTQTEPCPPLNSMSLYATDCEEIEQIINDLKNTSATGWDGIPTSVIKSAKVVLVPILAHIFNLSLGSGVFPLVFKKALVHPIHKGGDRDSVTNYRPISVLSTLSKILEKILNKRLVGYLETNNIIADNQYGFRKGKSTEDAVLHLTEIVTRNLNSKLKTIGLFLDLSKAFDTVSIPLLLNKLSDIGIRGIVHDIFKSYLSNRSQRVIIDDIVSRDTELTFGVPQGSVLGPTLFIIYVNELCKLNFPNCSIITYADDTALLIHGSNWNETRDRTEFALSKVMMWLNTNLLTLNLTKTNYVTFAANMNTLPPNSFHLTAHQTVPTTCVQCNCMQITRTRHIKYLGVWIDCVLSWNQHIQITINRVRKLIYIFKNLRATLDSKTLNTVYTALCQSILSYCITVWGSAGKTQLLRLERAQRAILKVMTSKPILFPTSELYKITDVLTVRQIYILRLLMRKHAQLPYSTVNSRSGRRADKVCDLIFCRLALSKRHFLYISPVMYNKVNKLLHIYPLVSRECKSCLITWLKSLSYTDTERFLTECL